MQGLPWKRFEHVPQKRIVLASRCAFYGDVSPIGGVTKQRVSDVLHVHADLVGASRFEFALDEGHGSQPFQHAIMRGRVLPFPAIFEDLLDATISQRTTHVTSHGAIFRHISPHQSPIPTVDCALKKLLTQVGEGVLRLSEHHQARCVLVQSVDEARTRFRLVGQARHVLEMVKHPIDQRS